MCRSQLTHSTDLINSVSEDGKDLDNELREIVTTPLSFPEFPCHTQAVECGMKFVTEAAKAVIGPNVRDGIIRQNI